ncbi:MAG: GNAT family N-acetyltransferase [Coprococcus sp.]|nr:GNAT family N-acetyltransferase [Coprococcus sp.]
MKCYDFSRYEFRDIRQEEACEAVLIEQICFPPHEACTEKSMKDRIGYVPELFMVAYDTEFGKIAGFLNGIATDEDAFRDEFFINERLNRKDGKNIMLVGLDVRPEYRGQGLAGEIVRRYAERERNNGRKQLILTCLDDKVPMYVRMGFEEKGIAASTWGGEEWHEMTLKL